MNWEEDGGGVLEGCVWWYEVVEEGLVRRAGVR